MLDFVLGRSGPRSPPTLIEFPFQRPTASPARARGTEFKTGPWGLDNNSLILLK